MWTIWDPAWPMSITKGSVWPISRDMGSGRLMDRIRSHLGHVVSYVACIKMQMGHTRPYGDHHTSIVDPYNIIDWPYEIVYNSYQILYGGQSDVGIAAARNNGRAIGRAAKSDCWIDHAQDRWLEERTSNQSCQASNQIDIPMHERPTCRMTI